MEAERESPLHKALASIDAINAEDPTRIVHRGVEGPKELIHGEVAERWLRHLVPTPEDAQVLAARAHHLRRWVVPRSNYPEGRAGYLRWRTDQKRRQATEVRGLLDTAGVDPATSARVAAIVAKESPRSDPQVQDHEDALCLAFLELQLDELADRLGHDKTVEVLRRTAAKMSPAGLAAVGAVPLSEAGRALVADAVG